METNSFIKALIIVAVTVAVLATGYLLGVQTRPKVFFNNGGSYSER